MKVYRCAGVQRVAGVHRYGGIEVQWWNNGRRYREKGTGVQGYEGHNGRGYRVNGVGYRGRMSLGIRKDQCGKPSEHAGCRPGQIHGCKL